MWFFKCAYLLLDAIVCGKLSNNIEEIFLRISGSEPQIDWYFIHPLLDVNKLNSVTNYILQTYFNPACRGDQISILYHPGWFPTIFENGSYQNGGVPQLGNLKAHLIKFQQDVKKQIPDKDNSGLAVIDIDLWRPVYRQNHGKLQRYKDVSNKVVIDANPHFSKTEVENEADHIFTEKAKLFMTETIELGKKLRPKAKWGYRGSPLCFNGKANITEDCEKSVQDENDSTQWLYDISDVILPSIYMTETISPSNRPLMVKGRVREARRLSLKVNHPKAPLVIAYHRYKFVDSLNYLKQSDNINVFEAAKEAGADGVVLWGAWDDVSTKGKCDEFYKYVENVLGPSFQKFVPTQTLEKTVQKKSNNPSVVLVPTVTSLGNTHFTGKILLCVLIALVNYQFVSY